MTRLSFRFAKRKSTAWCRWALRFACSVLAAAVSVDIPAEERGTGAVVSLDHSAADLKVPPDAGVIPVPGTDPIRIAVITFALPRDNLLIAEATKLALAPLFPNRGIKLIFCTFEEFDRIVLSRGAEFILGTSGAVTRLSTFGLRPLATLVSKGGSDPNRNEGSAVIVREDHREFQTLGDLKGRTIAASNALSFPGWQIVLGEVAKFGINPNAFFGKTIFTGDARSISDIVKLVLDDKADAGVLRLCAYEQFIERHPEAVGELRVLDRRDNMDVACVHSTDLYPGFTMAVTELISPEAARRATLALLSMPPTERGARWTIPTNYKSVDALLEAIRVGPSEKLRATMLNELIDDYLTWMLVIALLILGLLFHGWRAEVLARRQGERVRELMEQKMAQASRLASMQRAASLTQISSIFAHELRQPLTSASLYAEGLARQIRRGSADPDRMAKIADRIADETQRASEIVECVRAYAKGRRLERSVLSAADVMQSAVRLWRGQSMRDFPLWVLVPKSAAHISANAFELELVFVNLLKNAAEAAQAAWAADESSGKPKPVNLTKAPDVLVGSPLPLKSSAAAWYSWWPTAANPFPTKRCCALRPVPASRRPDQVKNLTVWGSALPSSGRSLRPASAPSLLGEPISILALPGSPCEWRCRLSAHHNPAEPKRMFPFLCLMSRPQSRHSLFQRIQRTPANDRRSYYPHCRRRSQYSRCIGLRP